MLKSIKLKNFRQHTDLTLNLQAGMTSVRGHNESGKSTVLEAIAYALFGVKAIRDTLDDCVTWGEATSSLRVDLVLSVDNIDYAIKRSKSGAELNYDGGSVTGQTEVTNFASSLLKMDAGAAARLTMSNQGEIRGALDAGTKATTELIERLAEFGQLDELIELMQEKLTLGSPAVYEARLAQAESTLEAAKDLAQPIDEAGLQALVLDAAGKFSTAQQDVAAAESARDGAVEAQTLAREKIAARSALESSTDKAVARSVRLREQRNNTTQVPVPKGVEEAVKALQDQLYANQSQAALRDILKKVTPFFAPEYTLQMYIPGGFKDLEEQLATWEATQAVGRTTVRDLAQEISITELKLTHGTCTFCGKDFSGVPEVEAKNAELRDKLATLALRQSTAEEHLNDADELVARLRRAVQESRKPCELLAEYPDNVKASDGMMPPYLVWVGDLPAEAIDEGAIRAQIATLRRSVSEAEAANAEYDRLTTEHTSAVAEANRLKQELDKTPEVNANAEREAVDAAREALVAATSRMNLARDASTRARQAMTDAVSAHARAKAAVEQAQEDIARCKDELKALAFNNALLKKVRAARPVIADKLWNIVLNAVSGYFSEIRGEKSRVNKTSDGFKVDGHPVSSMSGSTKDSLGLAIRVALVRTFLPTSPFLILDEPSAAMDGERTGNMLGFLHTLGLEQVILASHDPLSESVADHVMYLDA